MKNQKISSIVNFVILIALFATLCSGIAFGQVKIAPGVYQEDYDLQVPYFERADPNSTTQVRKGTTTLHLKVVGSWNASMADDDAKFVRFDTVVGNEAEVRAIYINRHANVKVWIYTKEVGLNETMLVQVGRAGWVGNDLIQMRVHSQGQAMQVVGTFWTGTVKSTSASPWKDDEGNGVWPVLLNTQIATGLVGCEEFDGVTPPQLYNRDTWENTVHPMVPTQFDSEANSAEGEKLFWTGGESLRWTPRQLELFYQHNAGSPEVRIFPVGVIGLAK